MVEFVSEFTALEAMSKNQKKDKARKKEDLPTGPALEPGAVYRTLLQLESETFPDVFDSMYDRRSQPEPELHP